MLNFFHFKDDFKSSIIVFLVALPLCLGVALASGAPLISGLIAGIVGGIVIGLISDSRSSVSGPAAGLTVIVFGAITSLGGFYNFTLAVFFAGVLQIIFGLLRAGELGAYFPNSVIKGMLAAIGIILILKQIPHAVGFDKDFMGDESFFQLDGENTFSEILNALQAFHIGSTLISVFSIFCILMWDKQAKKDNRFFQLIPSPLIAVAGSVLINEILFKQISILKIGAEHLVKLPTEGGVTSLLSNIHLPAWENFTNPLVFKVALTLAIVASLETLLSVEAVDKIDPHKNITDKNREMIAQGIGNSVSGFLGGLPVTSVIVRSSANVGGGGRTNLSTILHGLWILLSIILIPQYLQLIPLSCLATILILVGFKLCSPKLFKQMRVLGKNQMIPFLVTIISILFTDLLIGISIGLVAGIFFVLKTNAKKSIVVVNDNSNYLIRFTKDVSFLNKPHMTKILSEIPQGSKVLIDGSNHFNIDNDIIVIIEDFLEVCAERNISFELIKSTLAINPFFKETT